MKNTKLSAPWYTYYRELNELFGKDPQIKVVFYEDTNTIKLYVEDEAKAEALTQILPSEKTFGTIKVAIQVIPANFQSVSPNLFQTVFNGNPVFSYMVTIEGAFSKPITYVVFKPEVVQFFNDELGDINGNHNTLYQDIAKDVFENTDGIYFCTDIIKEQKTEG